MGGLIDLVVIPAFNEASTISEVVSSLVPEFEVVVVDDGSVDGTGPLAESAGAEVVCLSENVGYDMALSAGLNHALAQKPKRLFTFDADGQLPLSALVAARRALIAGADVVVGSRLTQARVSETWFSLVSKRLWGVADPLCGLKGFTDEALAMLLPFPEYPTIGSFFVPRGRALGLAIVEIPVSTRDRNGISRFGSGFSPNLRILIALARVTLTWLLAGTVSQTRLNR